MSGDRLTLHPLLQTLRGMCADEEPYPEIERVLASAVDRAKDIEEERDRLRVVTDEMVGTVCAIIENRCGTVLGIGPAVREALAVALGGETA